MAKRFAASRAFMPAGLLTCLAGMHALGLVASGSVF